MRAATDIGGTFTDLVAIGGNGEMIVTKSHTTPPNFEQGVIDALAESGVAPADVDFFIHGTTTIINALTERKGAKTALLTTKGFRDVLEIARMNRPDLFNLTFAKPRPFVPRYLRKEAAGRLGPDGSVITPLNEGDILAAVDYFKKEGVEAVAICFIHSYANDLHERGAKAVIRRIWPEVFVTASVDITKEWREYERTSTAVLNSYVMPVASSYINALEKRLLEMGMGCGKYIMQSNGGNTTFEHAKSAPINIVESGPVAGVYGAATLGAAIGEQSIIAFDVGGTTAKCSLIDNGEVKVTTEYRIERTDTCAGYPIMCPVVDIVEIGNGGGSIARIDEAGSLRVGPRSAGALPGPVAYGNGGTEPTTTDACLLTGRIAPDNFDNHVDMERVRRVMLEKIGIPLKISAEEAAISIIRVADSNMLNALRLVSVRRGYDPRDFALVAFGGGGPMHASYLAKELKARRVIIPVAASVFSAWGMLMTDVRHDYIQTKICRLRDVPVAILNDSWNELLAESAAQFASEGIAPEKVIHSFIADIRYLGQEHAVKVNVPPAPWTDETKTDIMSRFHKTHERHYTFSLRETPAEIVNLHLVSYGRLKKPEPRQIARQAAGVENAVKGVRSVYYTDQGWRDSKIYERAVLGAGAVVEGPAIVEERTASTVVCADQTLMVDMYGNLVIEMEGRRDE